MTAIEGRHLLRLSSMLAGVTRVQLLRAGLELGLFEALREPQREALLAEQTGLAPDLVASWLRAAEAHGLLKRVHHPNDAYRVSEFVRFLLDAPDSDTLQTLVEHSLESYAATFSRLPDLLRGGERPAFGGEGDEAAVRRVAAVSRLVQPRALAALKRVPGVKAARRFLDVGCGHGGYLIELLRQRRDARGVGIEQDAQTVDEARKRVRDADLDRRCEVREGELLSADLPDGSFDLILLNNNLYYFPPEDRPALYRRALSCLEEGGVLAIQVPVATASFVARRAGLARANSAFDLMLRSHRNLYGLPDVAELRESLGAAGFAATGERSILPGGAARYVWGRA